MNCPFCGAAVAPGSPGQWPLVWHLLESHAGRGAAWVGGRQLRVAQHHRAEPRVVECWCGRQFRASEFAEGAQVSAEQAFAGHLAARGGLECHLLELAFGIRDN